MSRIANNPVDVPKGTEVTISEVEVSVSGAKGSMSMPIHAMVEVKQDEQQLTFAARSADKKAKAMAGTYRSLVGNMVTGVTDGFVKSLDLQGVGYRAQLSGRTLSLSLGFSHPVEYEAPEGIDLEVPSQTQILVRGVDKQQVGQVAANIRAYRPPEPYKGKGVRYTDEYVRRKEAKKK